MLKSGDIIEFDRKKQFTYVKPLGVGGTGDTHLFEDEATDMLFAFKKYVPKDKRFIDEHYRRFIDEIKMLLKLSHRNIVRIYNYYLYPDLKTGYIQMEYIDGYTIDQYIPWGKDWNSIFSEVVSAFEYLEINKVLHRDIRSANILIDKDDTVKIIDFGFGKQLNNNIHNGNSILLNWPVTELPEEILDQEYNHKTEVYFVGKLLQKIIKDETDFKFKHVIENMIRINPSERYNSFSEVSKAISAGLLGEINFTEQEKEAYRIFVNHLNNHINFFIDKFIPKEDMNEVLILIANLIRDSALEEYIQDNSRLIECFISNGFSYKKRMDVPVKCLFDFYSFLTRISAQKKKIVLDNIYTRLSNVPINIDEEEIPF